MMKRLIIVILCCVFLGAYGLLNQGLHTTSPSNDVQAEIHLLRQMLNQETSMRMMQERELQEVKTELAALKSMITNRTTVDGIVSSMNWSMIRDINKEVSEIKVSLRSMNNSIDSELLTLRYLIGTMNSTLSSDILSVEAKISDTYNNLATLNSKLEVLNQTFGKDISSVNHTMTANQVSFSKTKATIDQTLGMLQQNVAALQKVIAFSAFLSSTIEGTLQTGRVIIFDRLITNIGNAYSQHTGSFISPVAGVYAFHWSILCQTGHISYARLMRNGYRQLQTESNAKDGSTEDHQTGSVGVLHLNAGDTVNLQVGYGGNQIYGDRFSSFSGWKIG